MAGDRFTICFRDNGGLDIVMSDGKDGNRIMTAGLERGLSVRESRTASEVVRSASMLGFSPGPIVVGHDVMGGGRIPVLWACPGGDCGKEPPFVLFLHGFGASKEKALRYGVRFAAAGLYTVMPDAPFHGERYDQKVFSKNFEPSAGPEKSRWNRLELINSYLSEAKGLLGLFARDGSRRAGVAGISMGGSAALMLAGETGVIAAAAFIPVLDYENLPEARGLKKMEGEESAYLKKLDPIYGIPVKPDTAISILCGADDSVVGLAGARKLDEALKKRLRTERYRYREYPGIGHDVTMEMADNAAEWMAEILAA